MGLKSNPWWFVIALSDSELRNPAVLVQDDCISILYSGGWALRWKSWWIVGGSASSRESRNEGEDSCFHVVSTSRSFRGIARFSNVHFEPLPSHKDYRGYWKCRHTVSSGVLRPRRSGMSFVFRFHQSSTLYDECNPILVYAHQRPEWLIMQKQSEWGYVSRNRMWSSWCCN